MTPAEKFAAEMEKTIKEYADPAFREKCLKLKVGDRVRYRAGHPEYGVVEGEIKEIWGTFEERTYSFKIGYGDSWFHVYPNEILSDS